MIMIYAALVAIMLFMLPGVNDPYQTPHLFAMALACVPMLLVKSDRHSSMETETIVALGLWTLAACFSRDLSYTFVGAYLSPFDCLSAICVLFCLLVGSARVGKAPIDVARAVSAVSIPMSFYAVMQWLEMWPVLFPPDLTSHRTTSTFGSPVYLGAMLAVCVPVIATLYTRKNKVASVALPLALLALYTTKTRGAWLAAAAGLAVLLPKRYRLVGLVVAPSVLLLARNATVASDLGRMEIYRIASRMFLENPFFGVGPGNFSLAFREMITPAYIQAHHSSLMISQHAHNLVLQVAATTGMVGLAALALIVSCIFGGLWNETEENKSLLGSMLVAYAVCAMFNPIPHVVVALIVVFIGSASSQKHGLGLTHNRFIYLPMAAVALYFSGSVLVGDRYFYKALMTRDAVEIATNYQEAARWNPWEIRLAAKRVESVKYIMGQVAPENRHELAMAMLKVSALEVEKHRHDAYAHEIHGNNILIAKMIGVDVDPKTAMASYLSAQKLAPTFPSLMHRRHALAKALKDTEQERLALADINRITAIADR